MDKKKSKKPIVLIIRDGWGYRKSCVKNAICEGKTDYTDYLMKKYPNILIDASGQAVGLPKGYQGNSEVGHMTIGSGRIIFQSLERINKSIKDKSFFKNKEFLNAIKNCKRNKTKLHLIGLLQDEGVHSHIDHLFALLDLCNKEKFYDVFIHVITDGRDAPVNASLNKIRKLQKKIRDLGFGDIVTISGRYFAMDRDKRWDRTKKAYDAIVKGVGEKFVSVLNSVKESHNKNQTDEFIIPKVLEGYQGIDDKDSVIFYNFRTDRTRQLTQAIVENKFLGWKRKPLDVYYVAMTQFYSPMNAHVAFKEVKIKNILGEVLSKNKKRQLRISETEKYAHVTFFFNGQIEKPFLKEDRILINSPKVATYDKKPEMSAFKITSNILKELENDKYDVIVTNIVNGDMVGHTGVRKACLKAAEVVDSCVKKIVDKTLSLDGICLIFADHGNLEDQTDKWRTSHTTNPVPFLVVSNNFDIKLSKKGGLSDIAPTVLKLLEIKRPKEMTGKSLIK